LEGNSFDTAEQDVTTSTCAANQTPKLVGFPSGALDLHMALTGHLIVLQLTGV
jgi:hypothetical protein